MLTRELITINNHSSCLYLFAHGCVVQVGTVFFYSGADVYRAITWPISSCMRALPSFPFRHTCTNKVLNRCLTYRKLDLFSQSTKLLTRSSPFFPVHLNINFPDRFISIHQRVTFSSTKSTCALT